MIIKERKKLKTNNVNRALPTTSKIDISKRIYHAFSDSHDTSETIDEDGDANNAWTISKAERNR